MLLIAWKNMRAEKARFAFSVGGVAVSALLLAFILALYSGWSEKIASYVEDVPADVWVSLDGNSSFFSYSLMSEGKLDELRAVEGVESAHGVIGRGLNIIHEGKSHESYVIAFDEGAPGGPIHIKKGASTPHKGEIIIDDVLARTAGISMGDDVTVSGVTLNVVGISTGGNNIIYQLSFVSKDDAPALIGLPGIVTFILINTEEGRAAEVTDRINSEVQGVNAYESKEFASLSRKVLKNSMLPILAVIVGLVFVVGAVVVGLTIYTATIEKEREYGVMKAMGTPNKFLLLAVVQQSLICGLIGFIVGEFFVIFASRFAERLVPQFVTLLRVQDAAIVLGAVVFMSIFAAYLPVQKVLSVDPLRVFKA